MKKFLITALLSGVIAIAAPARPANAEVEANVTIGGFHEELARYGQWVDCRYGQCWVPAGVASDWQPYTNGQWVYTEYGWTWNSNDAWGGDPFHYGTWTNLEGYGWSWIPGTVWAPAWVTWSYGDNYVGWAPLPPASAFGATGYAGRAVIVNPSQYVFVPMNRFVGANILSVRVSGRQNAAIFRRTTPVTRFEVSGGYVHNTGIPLAAIQHAGVRVETRKIGDARATPRAMTAGRAGGNRNFSVVAPASEVKAAVARPEQRNKRIEPRAAVKPEEHDRKTSKSREATPKIQEQGHAAKAPAPEAAHATGSQAKPARTKPGSPARHPTTKPAHPAPARRVAKPVKPSQTDKNEDKKP